MARRPTAAEKATAAAEKATAALGPSTPALNGEAEEASNATLEESLPTPDIRKGKDATELRFPKQISEIAGSAQEERAKIWARMHKQGIISLCNVATDEKRCYYPLVYVRDPAHQNDVKMEKHRGQICAVAKCSFDPEGHGKQFILPPKKEDEI